jgi:hypothetical protein
MCQYAFTVYSLSLTAIINLSIKAYAAGVQNYFHNIYGKQVPPLILSHVLHW